MFKTILYCSDGSAPALAAGTAAAKLARQFNAQVIMLNVFVYDRPIAPDIGVWELAMDEGAIESLAAQHQEKIERRSLPIFTQVGVRCEPLREIGHPVDRIVQAARDCGVDLIVMGSRGLSAWKALLLGSVTDAVVHQAPCPVLIARGDTPQFNKILLASDGSEGARKAVEIAGKIAWKFGSPLMVLNVFDSLRTYPNVSTDDLDPEVYSRRVLEMVRKDVQCALDDANVVCTVYQEIGHPAEKIVQYADANGSDLIVLGSRGLGAFRSLLLGSVADRIVHHAHCSVLIVR